MKVTIYIREEGTDAWRWHYNVPSLDLHSVGCGFRSRQRAVQLAVSNALCILGHQTAVTNT